jgi:3-oxoacyl-[acyl-carrier protein] reductase
MSEPYFNQKLFWITGASSGMGYAVAQDLAVKKAALIISSRSIEKLDARKKELLELGASSVETVELDLSQKKASEKIQAVLINRKISGLLLNAGGPKSGKASTLQYQDFLDANQLLVAGPANFLISMIPYMDPNNSSVVAITSSAVKEPVRELNLSAIYRSAFVVFLKNLAGEIGHLGIRVNNVAPGKIATEHLEKMIGALAQKNGISVEEETKSWSSVAALNRMGTPQEIAKVVTFLFSDEASFVNGQTILVDGLVTES